MNKHIYIIIIILGFSLFVSAGNLKNSRQPIKKIEATEKQQTYYTLKDYNGKLALFHTGEEKPIQVYDIFTSTLPEADIVKLTAGITETAEEINNIIADYTS